MSEWGDDHPPFEPFIFADTTKPWREFVVPELVAISIWLFNNGYGVVTSLASFTDGGKPITEVRFLKIVGRSDNGEPILRDIGIPGLHLTSREAATMIALIEAQEPGALDRFDSDLAQLARVLDRLTDAGLNPDTALGVMSLVLQLGVTHPDVASHVLNELESLDATDLTAHDMTERIAVIIGDLEPERWN